MRHVSNGVECLKLSIEASRRPAACDDNASPPANCGQPNPARPRAEPHSLPQRRKGASRGWRAAHAAGLAETYCAHLPYSARLSNNPLARAGVSHAAGGGAGGVGGAGGSARAAAGGACGAAAGGACGAAAAYGISANDALGDPTRIGSTTAAWGSVGGTGEAQAATSAAGGGGGAPGGRDPGAVWPPWRNGEHLAHHFGPAWDSKLAPLTLRDKLDRMTAPCCRVRTPPAADGADADAIRDADRAPRTSDIKRPQMTVDARTSRAN